MITFTLNPLRITLHSTVI